ncbi:hypothetical protein ACKX2D_09470 [Lachnospiraceae bacterium YH-ros2226]
MPLEKLKKSFERAMKNKGISCALFLAILLVLLRLVSLVSVKIPSFTGGVDAAIGNHIRPLTTLKEVPDHSIDLAFIGDSLVMTDVDTKLVDQGTGKNSILLSSPGMTILEAYHAFQELLECQSPRIIMFETDVLYYGGNLDGAKALIPDLAGRTYPVFFYHDTWKNLIRKPEPVSSDFKGFTPMNAVSPDAPDMNYMRPTKEVLEFSKFNRHIMNKITAECKKRNITLCLYSSVCPKQYSMERHNALSIYASRFNLPFIDLNMPNSGLTIDPHTDFFDHGEHLNAAGAVKSTEALIRLMQSSGICEARTGS